jgi:hypothetical protein
VSLDLLKLQRDLASLVFGRVPDDPDAYIRRVASSVGMEATRTIIASWRELMIRRLCPLTVSLLNRDGRLSEELEKLASISSTAWVDDLAVAFLSRLSADRDLLVAVASRFERGAIMASQGKVERVSVVWPCDPEELIRRLAIGAPLEGITTGEFETVITAAT